MVAPIQNAAAGDEALFGAAVGAIIGGATGAAIASQGEPRAGGYHYYQDGCYHQRRDGAWIVVAPEYCAASVAVEYDRPPPPPPEMDDPLRDRMLELRGGCEAGNRHACVHLGVIIGENRGRAELCGDMNIRRVLLRTLAVADDAHPAAERASGISFGL
jgi:hypothetical protein